MERVSLFSKKATPKQRYKLFSDVAEVDNQKPAPFRTVVCRDCGYEMETSVGGSKIFCPNCGGTRFYDKPEEIQKECSSHKVERVSLFGDPEAKFQKSFSETTDELELKYKLYSGKTLTKGEFQKEFGKLITESDLCEKGFGEVSDGNITISPDAFLLSRLFSSIKISITKSLELDPAIVNCENKQEIIDRLGTESCFPPKAIMLLKKAHNIPMQDEEDAWMEDSGICRDLRLEFEGQSKPVSDFKAIINERYPDAPEDVIDLLKKKGVIEVEGDLVKFI